MQQQSIFFSSKRTTRWYIGHKFEEILLKRMPNKLFNNPSAVHHEGISYYMHIITLGSWKWTFSLLYVQEPPWKQPIGAFVSTLLEHQSYFLSKKWTLAWEVHRSDYKISILSWFHDKLCIRTVVVWDLIYKTNSKTMRIRNIHKLHADGNDSVTVFKAEHS